MFQLGDIHTYDRLPPERRLLTLVFALVGRDGADELLFDRAAGAPEIRLRYRMAGQLHDLVPPPAHVWSELVRILRRSAKLHGHRTWWAFWGTAFPAVPTSGTLTVRYGRDDCPFHILFFRGPTGEHIWLERAATFDVTQFSSAFMDRLFRLRNQSDGLNPFPS